MQTISLKLLCWLSITTATVIEHNGINNYTAYFEGNSPIIFLTNHGGYKEPANINERHDGCYIDSTCDWTKNCPEKSRSAEHCEAKIKQDRYTQEIATCLAQTAQLSIGGQLRNNHLVINNLHRNRLDANRKIGEAAMGDSDAENAWDEIHEDVLDNGNYGWLKMAKDNAINQCGFGIMFDIHGQSSNPYNQFGYRLSKTDLSKDDLTTELPNYAKRDASIYNLVFNTHSGQLEDIIRGTNSLGTLLENKLTGNNGDNDNADSSDPPVNYLVVPSLQNRKIPSGVYYYMGGFDLKMHGSSQDNELSSDGYPTTKSSVTVDVIQIEINKDIRWNKNGADRDQFCQDFGEAIVEFIEIWYDLTCCGGGCTGAFAAIDHSESQSEDGPKQIAVWIIVLILVFCAVGGIIYKVKKKLSQRNQQQKEPLSPIATDDKISTSEALSGSTQIKVSVSADSVNRTVSLNEPPMMSEQFPATIR